MKTSKTISLGIRNDGFWRSNYYLNEHMGTSTKYKMYVVFSNSLSVSQSTPATLHPAALLAVLHNSLCYICTYLFVLLLEWVPCRDVFNCSGQGKVFTILVREASLSVNCKLISIVMYWTLEQSSLTHSMYVCPLNMPLPRFCNAMNVYVNRLTNMRGGKLEPSNCVICLVVVTCVLYSPCNLVMYILLWGIQFQVAACVSVIDPAVRSRDPYSTMIFV